LLKILSGTGVNAVGGWASRACVGGWASRACVGEEQARSRRGRETSFLGTRAGWAWNQFFGHERGRFS